MNVFIKSAAKNGEPLSVIRNKCQAESVGCHAVLINLASMKSELV